MPFCLLPRLPPPHNQDLAYNLAGVDNGMRGEFPALDEEVKRRSLEAVLQVLPMRTAIYAIPARLVPTFQAETAAEARRVAAVRAGDEAFNATLLDATRANVSHLIARGLAEAARVEAWAAAGQGYTRVSISHKVDLCDYALLQEQCRDYLNESRASFPALKTTDALDVLVRCGLDADLAIANSQIAYPHPWGGVDAVDTIDPRIAGAGAKIVTVTNPYTIGEVDFSLAAKAWLLKVGIDLLDKSRDHINKRMPQLKVSTFLNRLLGIPVREQQLLFDVFARRFEGLVRTARKTGAYDLGIMQIQSSLPGNRIKVKSGPALLYTKPGGGRAQVSLWEFTEDRSVSFEQSQGILADARASAKIANRKTANSKGVLSKYGALGYYVSKNTRAGMEFCMCVLVSCTAHVCS